jgi:hypothetical protein
MQTAIYSDHARKASRTDRYGVIVLSRKLDMSKATLIEAEEYNKAKPLEKIVFRYPATDKLDMVVVAIPQPKRVLFVKTVWFNEKGDNHRTLDTNRFAIG